VEEDSTNVRGLTMPIYSRTFTAPAGGRNEENWTIEGEVITKVSVRFPPGPEGELRVKIAYGLKSLAPFAESEWLSGDDEAIEWNEYLELPERKTTLRVILENDDPDNPHSVLIRVVTMPKNLVTPVAIMNTVYQKLDMFLSKLMKLPTGVRRR